MVVRQFVNSIYQSGVRNLTLCAKFNPSLTSVGRVFSTELQKNSLSLNGLQYEQDDFTNVTPKILYHIGHNLHNSESHPLCFLKKRIVDYFYSTFKGRTGNPVFSFYDDIYPAVSVYQNFDSLLISQDHPSRRKTDCYYINKNYLLRAHMTAHQSEMLKSGLDNFLLFGDVYRRDEIDTTHYPVFHQADAVRLCSNAQLETLANGHVEIFEGKGGKETEEKQAVHTIDATKIMENELKTTLVGLAQSLFGKDIPCRWVDVFFPFTHPSWELEVQFEGKWLEVLGCGIMRHEILETNGAEGRIGWAFGLGLERLAMCLYKIPDIRMFWSKDTGFTSQFSGKSHTEEITFKQVSIYPQCTKDISFWIPENFEPNDFHELVREAGGELIEQVYLFDEFTHPKTGKRSKCYRIIYRHISRTLTNKEVNKLHTKISEKSTNLLGVTVR